MNTQPLESPAPELRLGLLRTMLRIREFENRVAESYLRGVTAGSMFHLSVGEEAAAAGMGAAMENGDCFTKTDLREICCTARSVLLLPRPPCGSRSRGC